MAWRELPTWLKGGIIAIVTLLLLYIFIMVFGGARNLCEFNTVGNIHCTNMQVFQTFFFPIQSTAFRIGTLVIFLAIFGFGALIGWILGKIKSKK